MPNILRPAPKPIIRTESETPSTPAPIRRPRPTVVDELSRGRGLALRTGAVRDLGSNPFSAVTGSTTTDGANFRVNAAGGLSATSETANLAGDEVAAPASEEVQEQADDRLANVTSPEGLAYQLEGASPEVRAEMIRQVVESGDGQYLLTGFNDNLGQRNIGYDAMQEVADAVGEAYRAGAITDEQLNEMLGDMEPEQVEQFIATMAMGTNNTGIPGLVEALGEQAEALGYDRAAAIAFTSSDALIDAHYPTAEAQRAVFEHIESYLEEFDQSIDEIHAPELRHTLAAMLASAARLSARGTGYTDAQLDEELRELGPEFVGEAVAFAGKKNWNGQVPGPLDALGDSAARLADAGGDDAGDWQTVESIAYTQSPQLIEANLDTPEKREEAFDTLNAYLADSRDEWSLAENDLMPYSLLRAPEANDGLLRLLSMHEDEILTDKLELSPAERAAGETAAQGEADLVQLFESIALNPYVDQATRDRLTRTVEGYIEDQLGSADSSNAGQIGARLGRLLGTLQVAANRAIDGAEGEERSRIQEASLNVFANITGGLVAGGLTAATGPIGGVIGGAIAEELVQQIFGSGATPGRDEIERAVFEQLEAAGIDVSAGETGADTLNELFTLALDRLARERDQHAVGSPEYRAIDDQILLIQNLNDGFDTFGETLDSNEGGGQLAEELNKRDDEPV